MAVMVDDVTYVISGDLPSNNLVFYNISYVFCQIYPMVTVISK